MPKKKVAQNDNNLVVCYYRFSSHSQNEASIEQQRDAAHKWATAKGYSIVREYEDRAISGTTSDRPGYQQMLAEVSSLKPSVLILWKADRLGRDRFEVALARKTLSDAGCRVCYVAEAVPDDDSPEAALMEAILDGMADYYSRQLARNIRRGIEYNARHCLSNGHKLLGYKTDENKRYVIDEKTAPIVRRVFAEYAAGKQIKEIANDLNALGLRTMTGGKFNVHGLRKTLKNEKYTGVYRYGDVAIEGGMPRLVDRETFDRVQARFEMNKRKGPQRARGLDENNVPRYWLTGKLYCGECGHTMQGTYGVSSTGVTYRYYGCGEHLKKRGCKKKSVRKDRIEPAVIQILQTFLNDQELLASFAVDASAYYQNRDVGYRQRLENELRETEEALNNLIGAIEHGAFSDALQQRLTELESRKRSLEGEIDAEQAKADLIADERGIASLFHEYANANLYDPAVRDEVLEYFIEKIYVYDDRLVIQADLVDYVNDDRYHGDWHFGDYDVGFVREVSFECGASNSTIRNKGEHPSCGARPFFSRIPFGKSFDVVY